MQQQQGLLSILSFMLEIKIDNTSGICSAFCMAVAGTHEGEHLDEVRAGVPGNRPALICL
jgi:hypothetical protein